MSMYLYSVFVFLIITGLSRKGWFEGGGLWATICPGVGQCPTGPRLPSYFFIIIIFIIIFIMMMMTKVGHNCLRTTVFYFLSQWQRKKMIKIIIVWWWNRICTITFGETKFWINQRTRLSSRYANHQPLTVSNIKWIYEYNDDDYVCTVLSGSKWMTLVRDQDATGFVWCSNKRDPQMSSDEECESLLISADELIISDD